MTIESGNAVPSCDPAAVDVVQALAPTDDAFDFAEAEAALHGTFVPDIMLVARSNIVRTCQCPYCDSWMKCNRDIPDFCECPNCGRVH